MLELSTIQQITLWVLPMLFAITLHEAAHAWVASRCGDTTAKAMGRLSFNPLKHIDLIGTILTPIVILVFTHFNFAFGWAKPVPINPTQFRNPRRDVILVAIAGPLANFLMAILWAAVMKCAIAANPAVSMAALFFLLTARAGIVINLVLAILNLLPIPPLDGGRVIMALLPYPYSARLQKMEPFGFFILLGLLLTGILTVIMNPVINIALNLLQALFHL